LAEELSSENPKLALWYGESSPHEAVVELQRALVAPTSSDVINKNAFAQIKKIGTGQISLNRVQLGEEVNSKEVLDYCRQRVLFFLATGNRSAAAQFIERAKQHAMNAGLRTNL